MSRSTEIAIGFLKVTTMIGKETRTLACTSFSKRKASRAKPFSVVTVTSPLIGSSARARAPAAANNINAGSSATSVRAP